MNGRKIGILYKNWKILFFKKLLLFGLSNVLYRKQAFLDYKIIDFWMIECMIELNDFWAE